ncbi:hypothetical protein AKO1_010753 [Acrasis kona]|uniref:Dymeclin n=1 Tax=Acrasis kona TaxID=1008807 RepID=A0AAW2YQA3_9EUKA
MGQTTSATALEEHINGNTVLQQLSGEVPISIPQNGNISAYWTNDLPNALRELSLKNGDTTLTLPLLNPTLVEQTLEPIISNMIKNNINTKNLGGLMFVISQLLCESIRAESNSTTSVEHVTNGLVVFRMLARRIICEHCLDIEMMQIYFNSAPGDLASSLGERSISSLLLESMFRFLCETKLTTHNYLIHLEVLHCLFTLFSTTLYGDLINPDETIDPSKQRVHNIFLECALREVSTTPQLCVKLVQILLHRFSSYRLALRGLSPLQKSIQSALNKTLSAIFGTIGSAASAILYLPVNAYKTVFSSSQSSTNEEISKRMGEFAFKNIGRRSLMLLLVLLFYRKGDVECQNPYLHAFQNFTNLDDRQSISNSFDMSVSDLDFDSNDKDLELVSTSVFHLSFRKLYRAVVRDFEDEDCTLLTYCLLNENLLFLEYVLSRPDTDVILIPLLHKLYTSHTSARANHIYMMLIILMILTQDASFNKNMNSQTVGNPVWYKDRILGDVQLGSLLTIVLAKVVQHNISDQKDLYLNNNCLAIISNISPYYENIHTCAAQRLVFLIHALTNKFRRLTKKDASEDEVETYGKFLSMCLESVNACLTYSLKRNIRLVYELLYKRSVIYNLKNLRFAPPIVYNIDSALQFFSQMINKDQQIPSTPAISDEALITPRFDQEAEDSFYKRKFVEVDIGDDTNDEYVRSVSEKSWTVEEVMDIIEKGSKTWASQMRVLEHLPFRYTEDSNTEAFFVPYIWSIIVADCDYCNYELEKAYMLLPDSDVVDTVVVET